MTEMFLDPSSTTGKKCPQLFYQPPQSNNGPPLTLYSAHNNDISLTGQPPKSPSVGIRTYMACSLIPPPNSVHKVQRNKKKPCCFFCWWTINNLMVYISDHHCMVSLCKWTNINTQKPMNHLWCHTDHVGILNIYICKRFINPLAICSNTNSVSKCEQIESFSHHYFVWFCLFNLIF